MIQIAASRERATPGSSWCEYLCVEQAPDLLTFRLWTGQYEPLADRNDFYDPQTDDYCLPDEIDGKEVIGIEDDYVVGGDLAPVGDDVALSFTDPAAPEVQEWLNSNGWDKGLVTAVDAVIRNACVVSRTD
jgi:hypothetical protein